MTDAEYLTVKSLLAAGQDNPMFGLHELPELLSVDTIGGVGTVRVLTSKALNDWPLHYGAMQEICAYLEKKGLKIT